ncbi:PREDICTED: probable protein phosphatase 2C 35-like [Fragaria vesca subsp. vesca]|uniref:probable protein phosphatase 2C 35 n=1 Tax=Fragaria vesca subsp. vesca TaxID=101020 RepID=UPI0002C37099|nr:PREDICTED: probable protein phosphatase 2C 35 [Fragaria vesca subsp. vesca]
MGCVHGKCCGRFPKSSDGDPREFRDHGGARKQHILTERSLEIVPVPSHSFNLEYTVLTQKGYYPDSPDKENQDSFCVKIQVQGNPNIHFFGVFDGHGQLGTECSSFVKDRLVEVLADDPTLPYDPVGAYHSAFLTTNNELHSSVIDDTMSGTTAITVLVVGNMLYVANVGDSRAVIAVKDGNRIVAEDMSCDQTPFRKDEYERVKLSGARVLSVDQVEGLKDPNIQSWGDEESEGGDPPRLWVPNGMYPGTAFTRSVGDSTAEKIGVVATPEVSVVQLTPNHLFFVVASDGVFEFLSSQAVVNMAAKYSDPRDACAAIAGESYKLWLENENRTDDITIIIVHIKGLSNSAAGASDGTDGSTNRGARRRRKGNSGSSFNSGSEVFRSVRSDSSEIQSCQLVLSMNRNPAIVVPSPTCQSPRNSD